MAYVSDVAALITAIIVIAAYQFYLRILVSRDSSAVLSHIAAEARSAWVESIMRSPDNAVLAIQTLRNSTLAATFLASTAILLMVGILTLTNQSTGMSSSWHSLNFFGATQPEVWLVKLLVMLVLMFFAFFCFSNAIRIFNHVGYLINARNSANENLYSAHLVASELNRGGRFFSIGTRAYYYLIPMVCWLFGPLYLVLSALILVVILLPWVDRVPLSNDA